MELQVFTKNVEMSRELKDYVQRKIGKLSRYLPNIGETKVEISEENTKSHQDRFTVQVTIDSKGTLLRGEEKGENVYVAVDAVVEVLARQIKRYKGKMYKKGRGASLARQPIVLNNAGAGQKDEELQKVVKVKRFTVKPMSIDEATEQMELLGHNFFLFVDNDYNVVNLLYRRGDGNYGLIVPEMD